MCESGAIPLRYAKPQPHKATGSMSLDLPLSAAEYKATANLVWLADTGASYDVVPEGYAEIYGWKKVPLAEPIRINTANGPAETKGAVLNKSRNGRRGPRSRAWRYATVAIGRTEMSK